MTHVGVSQFPGGQVATTKQLICLANSRKHRGRCIAGIDIKSNTWIRPISSRPGHEVSESERTYQNGAEPRMLDVISMQLLRPRQSGYQRENWILDSSVRWTKLGQIGWADLYRMEQHPTQLWINSGDSTARGLNDRVPVEREGEITDSLKLIRVDSLRINGGSTLRRKQGPRCTGRIPSRGIRLHIKSNRLHLRRKVQKARHRYLQAGRVLPDSEPG
ncbi:hypothetical protein ACF1GS_19715 [Streptomyces eurythermus]|uniref:dual OB domain-containing protein n=1 Tax=Streptomyces eurythermus TaxID=42237 RepID=UPI0036FDCBCD